MPTSQHTRPKLCLIGNCLSSGGAEKVHAVMSLYFASKGVEVYNIVLHDRVQYEYGGELLNLGATRTETNGLGNKLNRLRRLSRFFRSHKFDYIIDFRYREHQFQEMFLTRFIFNAPYIPIIHSYMTHLYFPRIRPLAKMIFRKAYAVAAVAEAIKERVEALYGYKNVAAIYNPIETKKIARMASEPIAFTFPFIVGVGRMALNNIKQFDIMIAAYSRSQYCKDGVKLVLVGDGPQRPELETLAERLDIADKVVFTGFSDNPFAYMGKALFLMLTSRNEGFPNVITEAYACGTPVVSFDCQSGPREVIEHERNGLLVPDKDIEALIAAMDRMRNDKKLYETCKANALPSSERFSVDTIGEQWLAFLKLNGRLTANL